MLGLESRCMPVVIGGVLISRTRHNLSFVNVCWLKSKVVRLCQGQASLCKAD